MISHTEKQMLGVLLPKLMKIDSFNELFQVISIVKRHKSNFISSDEIKEMVRLLSMITVLQQMAQNGKEVNYNFKGKTLETTLKYHSKFLPKILEFLDEQNFKHELIIDHFEEKEETKQEKKEVPQNA